jgi:predicted permease
MMDSFALARNKACMIGFLSLCLPIFAVVLVGLFAARLKLVSAAVVVAIGTFSFNVALPAMLLRLVGSQPLAESFQPEWFQGYLGACLAVFAIAMGIGLLRGHTRQQSASLGAAAAMGNVGYLAPPLLLPMLGQRVAGPVAMSIMAEVAVIVALGSVLMAPGQGSAGLRTMGRGLLGLTRNPVILSIIGGCVLAWFAVALPLPVERFLAFLGNAAGPTALFALGGTLGQMRARGRVLAVAFGLALAKLVAYPALVWLVLGQVLGLDSFWVVSGTLLAAMPTATNAFVLAQRNDAAAEEVSAGVLVSTLLAALAFPATAWLLSAPVAVP